MTPDARYNRFQRALQALLGSAYPKSWEVHTKEEDGLRTVTIYITDNERETL